MKKIKVLMILALSLGMASCANDTYQSKRHPDANEESQVSQKAEDTNREEDTQEENTEVNDQGEAPKDETKEDEKSDVMAGVDYQVEDIVNIRLDPTTDSEIVGEAHPGDEILVLLEKDGWSRVSVNGQAGYIKSDLLKPVE
ncbi:Bacterial SH3 domain [Anaerococcus prevotii]|uniref:SH3 type 3 domain protein n=1 Tax=Anaerococcus prevotii (strain ATCC 9321 / DSM 20548 / JCM 6508 / NCTC 11806 / PC1) TaxID=525919 RepID=C7RFP0_ANAPD|nr:MULTISPECIES: SH3 domain-containing protein [Anaerococcus]ACV28301.1 SH3 type 3 domain protein [Anaerococcus prevotii DSM 20548]SUU93855.1 Bacterial SH3 domain [Anaerococcus prevotii]